MINGKPIRAFPEQDHDSHRLSMQFLQDPSPGGNPSTRGFATNNVLYVARTYPYYMKQEWNQLLVS